MDCCLWCKPKETKKFHNNAKCRLSSGENAIIMHSVEFDMWVCLPHGKSKNFLFDLTINMEMNFARVVGNTLWEGHCRHIHKTL